jgi:hypothetical protein
MKVTKTFEMAAKRDGTLISEDRRDIVDLPYLTLMRTFESGLWRQVNEACGTEIDGYEGVWLEPINLKIAANLIRQNLNKDLLAPDEYKECLTRGATMLDSCADRGERVMFAF